MQNASLFSRGSRVGLRLDGDRASHTRLMSVALIIEGSSRAETDNFVARLALEILTRTAATQGMCATGLDRQGLTDFDRAGGWAVAVAGANRNRRWASGCSSRRWGWRRGRRCRVDRLSPTRASGEGQGERECGSQDSHTPSA